MGCLFFSSPKAELVLALPVGARLQTWRAMNPQPPADVPAGYYLDAYNGGPQWNYWTADGRVANDLPIFLPRYRPGHTYHIGVPHWRLRHPDGVVAIWDEYTNIGRFENGADEVRPRCSPSVTAEKLRGLDYRRMPGMYLPGWAATHWAKCISVFPQRLGDATEEQARAELVELGRSGHYCDYTWPAEDAAHRFRLTSAAASFETMVAAVHKARVPPDTWGWRYEFEMAARPEKERTP